MPVDAAGFVDAAALSEMLADDVLAVSIMAVNNEIGTIQDIPRLSEIIKGSGALFHCDAAQARRARSICGMFRNSSIYGVSQVTRCTARKESAHCSFVVICRIESNRSSMVAVNSETCARGRCRLRYAWEWALRQR